LGKPDLADSFGQIAYHLGQLTHIKWIDHGWGGQTTGQIRKRFWRDAVGDTIDPGDGRGSVTLTEKPAYVVIEGGINDIAANIPLDSIESNLAWMVAICKLNNIQCILLNCIGQGRGQFNASKLDAISRLNSWLASGALDSTHVTVIDINSVWNSGIYGGVSPYHNDNIHFSALVNPADGIHFTQGGYDVVAHAIFRVARLTAF
jgi:lysophospholipase L1-like esterase